MSNTQDLAPLIEAAPELSWLQGAACSELDLDRLDLFFVDAGRTLSKEAAAMCRGCEARVDCVRHAYENEIEGGYFGGLSSAKRRSLSLTEAIAAVGH